jgi:hypothetical protein
MGPLTPFVMRCEYQTRKVQAVWAFHSQAASCLPSRLGFRALEAYLPWPADRPRFPGFRGAKLVKRQGYGIMKDGFSDVS